MQPLLVFSKVHNLTAPSRTESVRRCTATALRRTRGWGPSRLRFRMVCSQSTSRQTGRKRISGTTADQHSWRGLAVAATCVLGFHTRHLHA